jgi:hypothetical protein
MRKPVSAAVLMLSSAALAVGLSAATALATTAGTWSVHPGGAITGTAGTTVIKDTTSNVSASCTSAGFTGTLKSGTGLPGAGLGTVTSMNFNNCTAAGQTVSISSGTVAWPLNALKYVSTSGVTHGTITGIHIAVSSSVCSFVIDGTSGTAHNGLVKITYTNGTHKLKVLPKGDNLHVWNVSGCLGLLSNGDAGTVTSTFTVSPSQTITSP